MDTLYHYVGFVAVWLMFCYGAATVAWWLFCRFVDRYDKTRFFLSAIRRESARRHNEQLARGEE